MGGDRKDEIDETKLAKYRHCAEMMPSLWLATVHGFLILRSFKTKFTATKKSGVRMSCLTPFVSWRRQPDLNR